HIGDVRLRIGSDPGVHDVFVAPERFAEFTALADALVETANIAAGAEPALTTAFDQNDADRRIGLEHVERRVDAAQHVMGDCVDGRRPVQPDDAERAFAPDDELAVVLLDLPFGHAHLLASINLRATISRMISLVPSRIWCTRKSRTIFSMPYSLR